MILYHGTNQVIRQIDLSRGNLRTDFGKGFYLGSYLGVARDWAIGRAGFSGIPTVMRYKLDTDVFLDENVNARKFDSPTEEWLDFVRDNRRRLHKNAKTSEPRHSYGVVSGVIANDKVNFVVDDYIKGLISAEEAIKKVKAIPSAFQVSIHTPLGLAYLDTNNAEYQRMLKSGTWSIWYKL